MSTAQGRRLLLVHAHPDDESINNGATMAKYAAEGAHVTLVTCTLGEEGEVIPPELAHLAPGERGERGEHEGRDASTGAPAPGELTPLARRRRDELAAAVRELGVTDHRLLGGPGRYRDSGMMGAPTNGDPGCLWQADLEESAGQLASVVREVRPQVLVTYDPAGGYGHPDHIRAHQVAMRAVRLAAEPADGSSHTVSRVYWNCVPRSALTEGFARLHAGGPHTAWYEGIAEPADVPGLLEDETAVDAVIDGRAHAAAKTAAMRAHVTQISVPRGARSTSGTGDMSDPGDVGETFALSNGLGQPLLATEFYRLADDGAHHAERHGGPAHDLFAGVDA